MQTGNSAAQNTERPSVIAVATGGGEGGNTPFARFDDHSS